MTIHPGPQTLEKFIPFVNQLADASGAIIMRNVHSATGFENKSDRSPVTQVDREVELEIRKRIAAAWPDHGILGEEFAPTDIDRDFVWVIDPIDGTKPFIGGIPVFGTLIALTFRGTPVLGVIDHPYTKERWIGADGLGTTFNGKRVQTRHGRPQADSVMFTGNPEPFIGKERTAFDNLRATVNFCVYGANCYGYGQIARGMMDIGIESGHDPFDFCALVPVINNAGGRITDWEGNALTVHSGKRYVASGDPALHDAILPLLAGA